MFRSLATRLTASYVLAAIVLIVIVIAAVTTFALSSFGVAVRAASAAVARSAPDEARVQIAREGSLAKAAPSIVRNLSQENLRVVIFGMGKTGRQFLAGTGPADANGRFTVTTASDRDRADGGPGPGGPGGPPFPNGAGGPASGAAPPGPPPPFPPRRFERMEPFPFGLDLFLKLEPVNVAIPGGRLTIFPNPTPIADTIHDFWLAMLPIGAFVIVLAWFLGRAIAQQALRPLAATTRSLERFGAGDFTPRTIETSERNEIGALVLAYNAAAAQVAAAFEERRAVEAQMRQFVADASHELRTPLTVIMGFIDVLRRRAGSDESSATRIYDTMLAESRRMRALIEKLILLARLEHPGVEARARETFDLCELAERIATPYAVLPDAPAVRVERVGTALAVGDESEMHDAIGNLVENAVKYAPGAPVFIRARSEGNDAIVEVIDGGPGIAAEEQEHVFDRFYRGSERGESEGFGLGLAIARRAVERAGGELTLLSRPGAGCRFTVRVPRARRGDAIKLAV